LGRHCKPSRYRISRRLPAAAAPVLAGLAVAVCVSPQAMASPIAANAVTQRTTLSDTLGRLGPASTELLSITKQDAHAKSQRAATYTVKDGDTLSTIAQRVYHDQAAWPVIYWANHKHLSSANDLTVGQVLQVPAKPAHIPSAPTESAPAAVVTSSVSSGSSGAVSDSTYSGGGGFASCVISTESGGNSQVMNSSGHYGLYQFSASTWAEYGGSASDFGNASVAEQNQVFNNAVAAGGQSNWSAYDGC
jgi:LysM repeat protein